MGISIKSESLLTLTEATKILPRRRAGKKPHVSTLYRWSKKGIKKIILETIQIGGTTCTSQEALQRFFDRLQRTEQPIAKQKSNTDSIRQAESYLNSERF